MLTHRAQAHPFARLRLPYDGFPKRPSGSESETQGSPPGRKEPRSVGLLSDLLPRSVHCSCGHRSDIRSPYAANEYSVLLSESRDSPSDPRYDPYARLQ